MQRMGTGALAALTTVLAGAPAVAQTATPEEKPAISRGYNALESAASTAGARERLYTSFTLNKGPVPVTWSGFNEANVNDPKSFIGYNAFLAGSKDTKPMVVLSSNAQSTSARVGVRDEWIRKRLGFNSGYVDLATEVSGKRDVGHSTIFLGRAIGPLQMEFFEVVTRPYGPKHSLEDMRLGFYSEIQPNVSAKNLAKVPVIGKLGKLAMKACPESRCSDLELFYRHERLEELHGYIPGTQPGAGKWRTCFRNNLGGVRYTFK